MLHTTTSRVFIQLAIFLLAFSFTNCQRSTGDQYRFNGEMNVDGRSRTFLLNLPPGYYDNNNSKLSLVIVLHGLGGSATQAETDYGVTTKGNAEGFVVVYPEGIQSTGPAHLRSWNSGSCCPVAATDNVDDVHFISVLIDKLVADYKIDPKKVYVTGISNGAMMAYTLACDLADKIAAIGPVSGTFMMTSPCKPVRPVPVLHIHSAVDTKVPFYGGTGLASFYFPPVDSTLQVWSGLDSCGAPQVTNNGTYTFTEWKNQSGKSMINLYLTQDGGHSWPGGLKPRAQADPPSTAINATDVLWNFFKQQSMP